MKNKLHAIFSLLSILSLLVTSCGALDMLNLKTVNISMIYGSEKKEWLKPLVAQFHEE